MSKPTSFHAPLVAVAVICAGVLIWLWHGRNRPVVADTSPRAESSVPKSDSAPIPTATSAAAEQTPSLSPELRAMLTALVRALASGAAREREAVLAFKDEAAMRR